jgi:hypothetical protein
MADEKTREPQTHAQIDQKLKRLAHAKNEKERQDIFDEYAQLDATQKAEASACILSGQCNSVMQPLVIKAALDELNASCSAPRVCTPEARASITELNMIYARAEAITPVYPVETLLALGTTWGIGGMMGSPGSVTGGTRVIGGLIGGVTNYSFQDGSQPTRWTDVVIAAVTNFLGVGRGLLPNITINTSGALTGSVIKGDDPYPTIAGAALGTLVGYHVGTRLVETPLNGILNPWYRKEWTQKSLTISRWNPPVSCLVSSETLHQAAHRKKLATILQTR